jgi:hypothetical protein
MSNPAISKTSCFKKILQYSYQPSSKREREEKERRDLQNKNCRGKEKDKHLF